MDCCPKIFFDLDVLMWIHFLVPYLLICSALAAVPAAMAPKKDPSVETRHCCVA